MSKSKASSDSALIVEILELGMRSLARADSGSKEKVDTMLKLNVMIGSFLERPGSVETLLERGWSVRPITQSSSLVEMEFEGTPLIVMADHADGRLYSH